MNGVYRGYFKSNLPARTTVAVPALPGGAQFQVAFIASRKPHKAIQPAGVAAQPQAALSRPRSWWATPSTCRGRAAATSRPASCPRARSRPTPSRRLENIRLLLEAAGMTPANVVTANVYLTDMAMIGRMNEVYRTFFASEPPSRTTVGVPALPGDVPIEITFVATRSGKQVFAAEGGPAQRQLQRGGGGRPDGLPGRQGGQGRRHRGAHQGRPRGHRQRAGEGRAQLRRTWSRPRCTSPT